jgi:nucleoside-diphosphate-sugar epimerase
MNIFVAGGTGVLGRAAVPALVQAGHRVRSTARGPEKSDLVRNLGAEPVSVDLYDLNEVRRAIAGSDALIRLTTKIGGLKDIRNRRAWEETNRLRTAGARALVDAAIAEGVPAYIHESVTFVYADGGSNWLGESAPVDDGRSGILRAALDGEQEAARLTAAGGRGIVLRFGGFYGAGAPSTIEMVEMARRGLLFQFGSGSNFFSSIEVRDAGRAVAAAVNCPPGVYNVVDDEPVLFSEYVRIMAEAIGVRKPLRLPNFLGKLAFGEVWNYFSRSLRVSNARLKQATTWEPRVRTVIEGWPLVAKELHSHSMVPGGLWVRS